nr:MAG TPA: hypothetical protein [Caudoviricetes sp.]
MSYKVVVIENNIKKITHNCSLELAKELISFFDGVGLDAYAVPEL